jgi:hypothetical protein
MSDLSFQGLSNDDFLVLQVLTHMSLSYYGCIRRPTDSEITEHFSCTVTSKAKITGNRLRKLVKLGYVQRADEIDPFLWRDKSVNGEFVLTHTYTWKLTPEARTIMETLRAL